MLLVLSANFSLSFTPGIYTGTYYIHNCLVLNSYKCHMCWECTCLLES